MSHEQAQKVQKEVRETSSDGTIPCSRALELAERLEVSPRVIGRAADKAGIKIKACQLGCFK